MTLSEAARYREQKLVDTTLVTDAAWTGSQGTSVVIVSDDEDVIPGLVTARAFGVDVAWACRAPRPREPYRLLILNNQIEYIPC